MDPHLHAWEKRCDLVWMLTCGGLWSSRVDGQGLSEQLCCPRYPALGPCSSVATDSGDTGKKGPKGPAS